MPSTESWLETLLLKSAFELEATRQSIFQFYYTIRQHLTKHPIQSWEETLWARGLTTGLIRMEGYFFRAGSGKNSSLSFFVRNDRGMHVRLRRESITQAAVYVSLITEYGYSRAQTRFETGWMDVAVFDESRRPLIYAETKATANTLEKLCARLESGFAEGVDFPEELDGRHDDALMKAQHIWIHRPKFFWGVSPTERLPFEVLYSSSGFRFAPVQGMPVVNI